MLKKRKHKIKRRNTEPSVNHPLVVATPGGSNNAASTSGNEGGPCVVDETIHEHPVNLADICDSPTHATAV